MTRKKSGQGCFRVSNWLCLDLHRTLGFYNPLGCDFSLFFILWFIGALQLWLAYQFDLSRSALSHQSASLIPFAHWSWYYISLRPRKHKAPSSSKGPGTPSTSLMSWICILPRQLPYKVPRYQVLQAQRRNMTNIAAQYSRKINGQRNGHRLSKPPITAYPSLSRNAQSKTVTFAASFSRPSDNDHQLFD